MTPTPEKSCEEISAEILDMKDNTHYRDKAHLHPKFTEALLEKQKVIDALTKENSELKKYLDNFKLFNVNTKDLSINISLEAWNNLTLENLELKEAITWFIEWAIQDKQTMATPDKAAWMVKALEMSRLRKDELSTLRSNLKGMKEAMERIADLPENLINVYKSIAQETLAKFRMTPIPTNKGVDMSWPCNHYKGIVDGQEHFSGNGIEAYVYDAKYCPICGEKGE